jgi:Transposase DDE domain
LVGSLAPVGSFVRRVKTASGATAVQIVHKRGRQVVGIDHVGSAHDQDRLALLVETARQRMHADQHALELDVAPPRPADPGSPVVESTGSLILWIALCGLYDALGFAAVDDEAFRALVLGRIVEPTSKLDTVGVLGALGVGAPSRVTFMRCLKRVVTKDYRSMIYRSMIAAACYRHATRAGGLALVLYDVTTLYFETPREDTLRKVGMRKERRVDPQVTLGLLTDAGGFPLAVHLFEGNKAETKTLIPVLTGFAQDHQEAAEVVVVADAGMLSAANLLALEEAGFRFIVGSKISKAPYDLMAHVERYGNAFDDGQTIETTRTMGAGRDARSRRVVYQWRFTRYRHDNQAINAMIDRAEAVAAGTRPLKKDRFVKITDAEPVVDWTLVDRARSLAGLTGYVTNISTETMTGEQVVVAYHDLYQVERSFRMAKSDLAARPVFHRLRDSIEAHLTVVFAALAISREAQTRTGVSISKIVKALRPLRTATITVSGRQIAVPPRVPDDAQRLLDDLEGGH